jgi:hypothetical protein
MQLAEMLQRAALAGWTVSVGPGPEDLGGIHLELTDGRHTVGIHLGDDELAGPIGRHVLSLSLGFAMEREGVLPA